MTDETVDNVLLITYDSLRYDTWTEMQESLVAGPKLEAAGVHFTRAFATGPGTSPSFPGMLTGTLPLSYSGLGPLTEERPRVAENLRSEGFTTGGFQSNPFLSTHFNYDDGFNQFKDYQNPLMGVATKIFPRGIEINNPKLESIDEAINLTGLLKSAYRTVTNKARPYVSAELVTDDSIAFLNEADEPFFCWSHYMDVHHPCYPPAEYRRSFNVEHLDIETVSELYSKLLNESSSLTESQIDDMKALYRAAIVYVDEQINRLIGTLESNGQMDNTLVVLTSDHGELFGEYGQYGKPERMYDELIQVPLVVVNGPSNLATATDDMVSLLDIPPLIHKAAGVAVPREYEGQYPGTASRDHIVAEHEVNGDAVVGIRAKDYVYEIDEIHEEERLRNTNIGKQMTNDARHSAAVARIKTLAEERVEQLGSTVESAGQAKLDADVEARLEELGYR